MKYNLKKWAGLSLMMVLLPSIGLMSCSDDKSDEPINKAQSSIKFVTEDYGTDFGDEVESVALYVFDDKGLFVKVFEDSGDRLSKEGYTLSIDGLKPGTYSCVAWCGLKNDDDRKADFTVSDMKEGVSTRSDLLCRMAVKSVDGEDQCSADLNDLFFGSLEGMVISDKNDAEAPLYTVNLIQDTKEVEVILTDVPDITSLNAADYTFTYTDNNAVLGYDNCPVGESKVVYLPYSVEEKKLDGDKENSVVAKFKVNRLMTDSEGIIVVTDNRSQDKMIARIPLVDIILSRTQYKHPVSGLQIWEQDVLDLYNEFSLKLYYDDFKN
ncbi:MAG: FimB/Mfa2 family fimbrial subunit [Muribaculaceae bacterium]|nr:FimB/Mfa2 family fimbrial subunit [Muribaculaceae bacterium]